MRRGRAGHGNGTMPPARGRGPGRHAPGMVPSRVSVDPLAGCQEEYGSAAPRAATRSELVFHCADSGFLRGRPAWLSSLGCPHRRAKEPHDRRCPGRRAEPPETPASCVHFGQGGAGSSWTGRRAAASGPRWRTGNRGAVQARPSARIALSLNRPGLISSRIPAFSRSFSQRSGVSIGKSVPNSTFSLRRVFA
jgi:hypothetical protein